MPTSRAAPWMMLLFLAATVVVYWDGLSGPFLFDDHIHISQNKWVKIETLGWSDLRQAWNSSFADFPANRPLAQLSFGINHALSGPDPRSFKATNLAIHLLNGGLVFIFVALLLRALSGGAANARRDLILAAATAGVWLLHPLHVSTVLYAVQRMAQISALGLLVALSCYSQWRISFAQGRRSWPWLVGTLGGAALGFLGKENAVLLPLFLLVSEITVLRRLTTPNRQTFHVVRILFIGLPLAVGILYFFTHPGLLNYDGRPFTLEERVLTQARVLWRYLQWLLVPDITAFGLFHDDIPLSRSLSEPWTTSLALTAWLGVVLAAVLLRTKAPLFAFAALFYLASHALESTVIPLEMVFEHRNYLGSIGPLLLLAHAILITSRRYRVDRFAVPLGALLLLSYAAVTHIRAGNWSSYERFILSTAEHHPGSARSNFMAAQLLISSLDKAGEDKPQFAKTARDLLHRGLEASERCINCLFGLVVLDLHLGRSPPTELIERLTTALRSGGVGPTEVSISQFSFLVKWAKSDGEILQPAQLEAIFDAALENPGWSRTGRGGIEAAYREYFEFVCGDYEQALVHARAAVAAWPDQWSYHMQLVQVLNKLGRGGDALKALERAEALATNEQQLLRMDQVRKGIEAGRDT